MITIIIPLVMIMAIIALYIFRKLEWFMALVCLYLVIPIDMITPFIDIGSHYILLATLFAITCIELKKKNIYISKLTIKFLIAWAGIFIIYLIAYLINGNHSSIFAPAFKFTGVFAFVSEVVLLILLAQLLNKQKQINAFKKFILLFISLTSVFVLMQIYFGNIGIPLTKAVMHSKSLDILTQKGYVTRAMGLTSSPVLLAALLLMIISIMLAYSIKNKVPFYYYLLICFTGFIAMLTNTKTFTLGLPLAIVVSIILVIVAKKNIMQKLKQIGIYVICLIIIFAAWFLFIPQKIQYVRNAYIAYLGPNITKILDTRQLAMLENQEPEIEEGIFDGEETNEEIGIPYKNSGQVIKENWLIGVGPVSVYGEYFTDMSYIAILHNGGVIAFAVLLGFYLFIFIKSIKKRNFIVISSLVVTAAIFLTFSWYINCTYVPFIAFSILLLQDERKLKDSGANNTILGEQTH